MPILERQCNRLNSQAEKRTQTHRPKLPSSNLSYLFLVNQTLVRSLNRITEPSSYTHSHPFLELIIIQYDKMSVQLPPPTHRQRAPPQGELEAASTLRLGADHNAHTLTLSEARLIINKVLENKRGGGKKYEEPEYV